jgi:hypothetical protein
MGKSVKASKTVETKFFFLSFLYKEAAEKKFFFRKRKNGIATGTDCAARTGKADKK